MKNRRSVDFHLGLLLREEPNLNKSWNKKLELRGGSGNQFSSLLGHTNMVCWGENTFSEALFHVAVYFITLSSRHSSYRLR